jgi:methyl-accepting chemotaxis protein
MAGMSTGIGGAIVLGIYLKYRRGLATRLFGAIIPLCVMVVIIGYYIGSHGMTFRVSFPMFVAGTIIGVPWILLINRAFVVRLGSQVSILANSTAEIAAAARQSATTAQDQAATVAQVSATIMELRQTSAATASAAKQVSASAGEASRRGYEGLDAARRARAVLELVAQVQGVVDSVREFADQSNLLAVNAGIEAAKAGEHGRGFAVVATEVRTLAEHSKAAAQRIRTSIAGAESGKRAIEEVDQALNRLTATLDESTERSNQIAATAAQEAAGVQQIADAMHSVSEGGNGSAAAARQLEEAIRSVALVTDELERFVTG